MMKRKIRIENKGYFVESYLERKERRAKHQMHDTVYTFVFYTH